MVNFLSKLINLKKKKTLLGWFVDDTTSNDTDSEAFSKALAAATNITDEFHWPTNQLSFQSVYENVSVCIFIKSISINEKNSLYSKGCEYLFWFSSK